MASTRAYFPFGAHGDLRRVDDLRRERGRRERLEIVEPREHLRALGRVGPCRLKEAVRGLAQAASDVPLPPDLRRQSQIQAFQWNVVPVSAFSIKSFAGVNRAPKRAS